MDEVQLVSKQMKNKLANKTKLHKVGRGPWWSSGSHTLRNKQWFHPWPLWRYLVLILARVRERILCDSSTDTARVRCLCAYMFRVPSLHWRWISMTATYRFSWRPRRSLRSLKRWHKPEYTLWYGRVFFFYLHNKEPTISPFSPLDPAGPGLPCSEDQYRCSAADDLPWNHVQA